MYVSLAMTRTQEGKSCSQTIVHHITVSCSRLLIHITFLPVSTQSLGKNKGYISSVPHNPIKQQRKVPQSAFRGVCASLMDKSGQRAPAAVGDRDPTGDVQLKSSAYPLDPPGSHWARLRPSDCSSRCLRSVTITDHPFGFLCRGN